MLKLFFIDILTRCLLNISEELLTDFTEKFYQFLLKYILNRVPAAEIFKLSLSPYFDDIAVFHVRAVRTGIFWQSSLNSIVFSLLQRGS